MTSVDNDVPRVTRARTLCTKVAATCHIIRRDPISSAVARACARAIYVRAVHPFQASCAAEATCATSAHFHICVNEWLDLSPVLCELTTAAASKQVSSHSLMSHMASDFHRVPRNSQADRVFTAIWRDSLSAYSYPLQQWLLSGSLHGNPQDFFIVTTASVVAASCTSVYSHSSPLSPSPCFDTELRHHTTHNAYFVDRNRLPSFISQAVADRILFVGRVSSFAISMLEEPTVVECSQRAIRKGYDTANDFAGLDDMATCGRQVELAFESASVMWRDVAAMRLTRLIPSKHLRAHLSALRCVLLLGNDLLWRIFVANLGSFRHLFHPGMTAAQMEVADRMLERIVDASVASNVGSISTDSRETTGLLQRQHCVLRLKSTTNGDLLPSIDLPFPSSAVVGNSEAKYRHVFAIAFGVRRAVLELNQCFAEILITWRSIWRDVDSQSPAQRRLKQEVLRKCSLLRTRMSGFVQAFDNYLQVDVFECGFQSVLRAVDLMDRGYFSGESTSGSNGSATGSTKLRAVVTSGFSGAAEAHAAAIDSWVSQSLAGTDALRQRLSGVCVSCLELCEVCHDAISGHLPLQSSLEAGWRIENAFMLNAGLLVRVVSNLQGRIGSSHIGLLVSRLDPTGFYRQSGEGGTGVESVFEPVELY
jgi:Gamma tubulin complex component C-terminal